MKVLRWLRLWCAYCHHATDHECLPDVPNDHGLLWRCSRCLRSAPRTAHEAERGIR